MSKTALPFAKPGKLGLNADGLRRLSAVLKHETAISHLPGAVAMIARGGHIGYFEKFGWQNAAAETPMELDSIFRIYSMTKPIVSVAIMMMVEEGHILLSDPLTKYIPAFKDTKVGVVKDGELTMEDLVRPITIQDLLRHTSGLTYEFVGDGPIQKLYQQARIFRAAQTSEDQVATLASLPLLNQPGACWDYSRSTDVLGRILELVTGWPLSEALSRLIFDPLGMKDTGFTTPRKKQSRIAEPYSIDFETGAEQKLLNVREKPTFESGGGGLVSTAMDYAKFCAMLAAGGTLGDTRIIARKTLDLMVSDHLGPSVKINSELLPPGYGFGLGFAVRLEPGMSVTPGSPGQFFWGGIAGTTFWVDPEEDLFAILMIQAPNQRDYYRTLFRSLVYGALN